MKAKLHSLMPSVFAIFIISTAYTQSHGDYRSKTSGNWSNASSWETFNGADWVNATKAPDATDSVITILKDHIIKINTSITIDQTVVEEGGSLIINPSIKLTVTNGPEVDLLVRAKGQLKNVRGNITSAVGELVEIENRGSINVTDRGILRNDAKGTFTNTDTSTLTLDKGSTLTNNGTFINTDTSTIILDSSRFTNSNSFFNNVHSTITVNHGNLENKGTFSNNPGCILTVSSGNLNNEGTFSNLIGYINIYEGNLNNKVLFNNNPFTIITIRNGLLNNNGTFNNSGAIDLHRGSHLDNLKSFHNNPGGSIDLRQDTLCIKNIFTNDGTIVVTKGGIINEINFINRGKILVNDKSFFDNTDTLDNDGIIAFTQSSNLYNPHYFHGFNPPLALLNNNVFGSITFTDSSMLENHWVVNNDGIIALERSSRLTNVKTLNNHARLNNNASGRIALNEHTLNTKNGSTLTNNKIVNNYGKISINQGSSLINDDTVYNNIGGSITLTNSCKLDNNKLFSNKDRLILNTNSVLTNDGTFINNDNGSIALKSSNIKNNVSFVNESNFRSSGGTISGSSQFNNNGIFTCASSTITIFEQRLINTGTINGSGTLSFTSSGYLINTGTISPGESIGTLTILGANPFQAASTLEVEVGPGKKCDLLVCDVDLTLAGILNVSATLPLECPYVIVSTTGTVSGSFNYTSPSGTSCLEIKYYKSEVVLPLKFTSFYGQTYQGYNQLFWTTEEIQDVEKMLVQRSEDGKKFEDIGEAGTIDMIQNSYFRDNDPHPGKNYYRLVVVNINGSLQYSNVILLFSKVGAKIITYSSSPTSLHIKIRGLNVGKHTLSLYNVSGQKMIEKVIEHGVREVNLPTNGLAAGIYQLILLSSNGEKIAGEKVLLQHK